MRQTLPDFGQMPVSRHPIGFEIVSGFGKQRMHFRIAARAGDTGFGIGDEMIQIYNACLDQGQETQLHCGWITAGICV